METGPATNLPMCSVSGRDSAQELLRKSALVQSTPLLQTMIDAMPGGVVILNARRQIIAANQPLLRMVSATLDEVRGQRLGEILGCPFVPEGPDGCGTSRQCRSCGVLNAVERCQATGRESAGACDILVDRPIAGSALELRIKSSTATLGDEQFVVCAMEDISAQKRLTELATLFFHDVLNTIGGIQGHLELVSGNLPEGEVQDDFQRVHWLADQLVDEIEAHRDMTLAESGDLEVQPQVVRIRPLIEDLRRVYALHSVGAERFIHAPDVWDGVVITDLRLLSRVLGNLLRNALEATAVGGAVTLSCAVEPDGLLFRIANAGVIPAHLQEELFRRPCSTKGRSRRGIGARSIKILGERYLRGKVGFTSDAASGTTFWLRIPKVLAPSAQVSAATDPLEIAQR